MVLKPLPLHFRVLPRPQGGYRFTSHQVRLSGSPTDYTPEDWHAEVSLKRLAARWKRKGIEI